jgi:hypothetical protein
LKGDYRYTPETVFDSFPWPQNPILKVSNASSNLRKARRDVIEKNKLSLRELYRAAEQPGSNTIKDAQTELDEAVEIAFGKKAKEDNLEFLLDLNDECSGKEMKFEPITGPGLPNIAGEQNKYISNDCVQVN